MLTHAFRESQSAENGAEKVLQLQFRCHTIRSLPPLHSPTEGTELVGGLPAGERVYNFCIADKYVCLSISSCAHPGVTSK